MYTKFSLWGTQHVLFVFDFVEGKLRHGRHLPDTNNVFRLAVEIHQTKK